MMSDFPNWHYNFSLLTLAQRQTGPGIGLISDGEIHVAINSSHYWHNSAAFPLSENQYFLIGYTDKLWFLLVALSYSDDETFTIHDVAIADESQVQELYCGGAAS